MGTADVLNDGGKDSSNDDLESGESDQGASDISSRLTIPDVDGLIIQTAQRIIEAERERAVNDKPTIPPGSDYSRFVKSTAQEGEDGETNTNPTQIPDELELNKLVSESFGDKYIAALKGGASISQPPVPDLHAESELLGVKMELPQIEVDEASLVEQLMFNDEYMAINRMVSLFEEGGISIDALIYKVEKFVQENSEPVSAEEINDIFVISFRHLITALLSEVKKNNKYCKVDFVQYAKTIVEAQNLKEKGADKAFILTLRIILRLCELYEIQRPDMKKDIYEQFIASKIA